jgi:plasmid stabilization system protein ParE
MASWFLTESAERDLDDLLAYLALHRAGASGEDIALAIFDQIRLIAAHPLAFPVDGNGRRHSIIPRMWHRITYRYAADLGSVHITAITHARRPWERS